MLDYIYLLGGLAAILWGADALTDGAASVARRFHISSLVIGLTIVAFGTSMPEFVISLFASLRGSAGLAVGNVVGSNLFNTLLIVGCTALVAPISLGKGTLQREIPFTILAAFLLCVCASDALLDGPGCANRVSRTDGLLLLCFFVLFLAYTFATAHQQGEAGGEVPARILPGWRAALLILLGLAALIGGGKFFVTGAADIARAWGVSESTIGLTLVSGGSSLPELATSVIAAMKKNPDMAIGNVVGSNLFNILLVLGSAATVSPLGMGGVTGFDLLAQLAASALLWIFAYFYKRRTITRLEGGLLVVAYALYLWQLL